MKKEKAVVILSGGLDSTTTAAIAIRDGFSVYALTFDYGQRHTRELKSAALVSASLKVKEHLLVKVPLFLWGSSALTDSKINVPTARNTDEITSGSIPLTYVPARNLVFLSLAVSYAEAKGSSDIYLGVNQLDYSGYPDCREEFIQAFEKTANYGTKAGTTNKSFRIHTPLIKLTKKEIIELGTELGVDYGLTWSCYQGGKKACGECDSCLLRLRGFQEANLSDPVPYKLKA